MAAVTADVLTLNLWGRNGPLQQRMGALVSYLDRTRPDVVALQEVEDLDDGSQAHVLAGGAGYPHVQLVRTGDERHRGEGLAVLSLAPSSPRQLVRLPLGEQDHPRGLQAVEVVLGGIPLLVANTHLSWRLDAGADRRAQLRRIRDWLAGTTHRPLVVAGDLNDVPGSDPITVLTAAADGWPGLVDAFDAVGAQDRPTFALSNPWVERELAGRRVDHVLVDPDIAVEDAAVVLTGTDAPRVSDHYGVRARLRLPADRARLRLPADPARPRLPAR